MSSMVIEDADLPDGSSVTLRWDKHAWGSGSGYTFEHSFEHPPGGGSWQARHKSRPYQDSEAGRAMALRAFRNYVARKKSEMAGLTTAWVMGNCKLAELERGFANVYDESGAAVMVAVEVSPGDMSRLLMRARYEHGVKSPGYTIFQDEGQAREAAKSGRGASRLARKKKKNSCPGCGSFFGPWMTACPGCGESGDGDGDGGGDGGSAAASSAGPGVVVAALGDQYHGRRDNDAILERIRGGIGSASREQLIEWLEWNDRNGMYSDEDLASEGYDPMTMDEARRVARDVFLDPSHMSPEEAARWAGPGATDPMARMYDLNKKGPQMTTEENEELRGLIGQHGRPKFMSMEGVVVRLGGVRLAGAILYKGYVITHDPPPIPHRGADWQFAHEDYDGAPDSRDQRHGTAGSLDDAKRQIDEIEVEGIYRELRPDADPDPMARMYDLRKRGPDMTPEEDAELRGLIGRHGRPKFMANKQPAKTAARGDPTSLNLWVLKKLFGDRDEVPNGTISPASAESLRRCLRAGLFTIEGGRGGVLRLTDEGRQAIRDIPMPNRQPSPNVEPMTRRDARSWVRRECKLAGATTIHEFNDELLDMDFGLTDTGGGCRAMVRAFPGSERRIMVNGTDCGPPDDASIITVGDYPQFESDASISTIKNFVPGDFAGALGYIASLVPQPAARPTPDPLERMYDLRKRGPDMTPEEDLELRGLIGRHGRPKFMARDKRMRKQAEIKANDVITRSVREVLKGYQAPTPEDPWAESNLVYVWKDLMERVRAALADADSEMYGSQSEGARDLGSFQEYLWRLIKNSEARQRSQRSFTSQQELDEHIEMELGIDLSPPAPPAMPNVMESWVRRNCKFAAYVPSVQEANERSPGIKHAEQWWDYTGRDEFGEKRHDQHIFVTYIAEPGGRFEERHFSGMEQYEGWARSMGFEVVPPSDDQGDDEPLPVRGEPLGRGTPEDAGRGPKWRGTGKERGEWRGRPRP